MEATPKLRLRSMSDPLYDDTDPEAEAVQIALYRRMSPTRKLELVFDAIDTGRELTMAGLRARHPEAGDAELHRRFADLWLGEELAKTVYGPLEDHL